MVFASGCFGVLDTRILPTIFVGPEKDVLVKL